MSKYKCNCGNTSDFFIEHNLSQCGLYCGECGKWQKWLNKDEERLFKHKQGKLGNRVISDGEIINIINTVTEYMYCNRKDCHIEDWEDLQKVREEIKENAMDMIKGNLDNFHKGAEQ